MKYAEESDHDKVELRRKLKLAIAYTSALFIVAGVAVVIEVFSLLALQFCDGEDLMSLYWSTWTMLQLGAEIAILGVVLALYHALFDIRHPKWALALGTPVLVVAGFGHVIPILFHKAAQKLKVKHEERRLSRNVSRKSSRDLRHEKTDRSSASSINPVVEQRSRASSITPLAMSNRNALFSRTFTLAIDVGSNGAVVSSWPSYVGMDSGKALIQATVVRQDDFDLEAQRPKPSTAKK